jgi:MFS family permease
MFAVNLSAPFFNVYLLDNLALDLNWITIYASLRSGANLVMLILWGKLADRGESSAAIVSGHASSTNAVILASAGADSVSLWVWLPLIHLLTGVPGAALDLCGSNIQMELAPVDRPSRYFAIAAAVGGICGGLGKQCGLLSPA